MKRKIPILNFFMFVCLCSFSFVSNAQEAKYQAAYIYNFTNFIEWPSEYRQGNFIIGVLDQDKALLSEFNAIAAKRSVKGQTIEIKAFNSVSDISKCHILFVPKSQSKNLLQVMEKVNRFNTLVVSADNGAINKGAAINFVMADNKLNFEIKSENASKLGLKLAPDLERLAMKTF
ncbi:MAG: YfiR family protein [Bacteroidales bacterium]|nr:YfiR family protein [Bacteroidales bacterium]